MNIHEYQAQELLRKFGVATPRGTAASTPEEAERAAIEVGTMELVAKTDSTEAAQVKKKLAQQKLSEAMNMKGRLMVDLARVDMDIATAQAREVNPEVGAAPTPGAPEPPIPQANPAEIITSCGSFL